jgi:hypothetical protein
MMDSEVDSPHAARLDQAPAKTEGEPPGLPGLRTWRAVYGFVLAAFVLWVVLFALLSRYFS